MKWSRVEIEKLSPILEQVQADLAPLEGKSILVLCSAAGDVALVSEFIIFPTPVPTEIGQPEMARVLKPGGKMVLTDVIFV